MVRLKHRFLVVQANLGVGKALVPGSVTKHHVWAAVKVRPRRRCARTGECTGRTTLPAQDALVADFGNAGLGRAQLQLQGVWAAVSA